MIASSSRMTLHLIKRLFVLLSILVLWSNVVVLPVSAQAAPAASARKLKTSTPPDYPELARKMNIQGIARVLLTVSTDGRVVGVKELGGNPVLVSSLANAVKKWKYEPADHESEIEVRFEFSPGR